MSKLSDLGLKEKRKKNRSRLEIVRDVLSAATEKTRKTRIMYQANLSFRLMEKYLKSLLESGLMDSIDDSFYLISWRGKEFLQMYEGYIKQCSRISEKIKGVRKDRLLLQNMCFNVKTEGDRTKMLGGEVKECDS